MIAPLCLALLLSAPTAVAADDPPKAAGSVEEALDRAKSLTDKEEWAEAVAAYRKILRDQPEHGRAPEARFWAGFGLVKLGDHAAAVELLEPFRTALAGDKWADDAMLQLGHGYKALGDADKALEAWDRQVEAYRDSVWRVEVMNQTIDLLFHVKKDLPACLARCERMVGEIEDRETTTEARYLGAYCLNALRRFDESERWAAGRFDPETPIEEAWRSVLKIQRDLLDGRADAALKGVDALPTTYPDLDQDDRVDLLTRLAFVLRFNGRVDRARLLLMDELKRPLHRSEDDANWLFDQLAEVVGDGPEAGLEGALTELIGHETTPVVVRAVARDRLVRKLRDEDAAGKAEELLRKAVADDPAEFGRFRAATGLADLLAEAKGDRPGALRVLKDLEPTLKRRDLAHKLREAARSLETPPPG